MQKQLPFVSERVEKFLTENGWEKVYERPPGGHQTWQEYHQGFWELLTYSMEDNRHNCNLWHGSDAIKPEAVFSLRSIRAVLRWRGLAT
ncbi:hypothetical protein [Desulfofundulus thermosubterraneus]|uniref:Uncharacterized protein n=1 Tax=Desulfofundulus thermosubterraneus DSM 16057 TaxID=1121432 RepID=A0A1M6GZ05_9FIRM|nr:hypothetical protein [Desulfofundulus thermosubterraneus]SHJ15199.1 hypothetical protein SAMN02745219_01858 [Desulfofundulus thermosubterraneus DSM 16057]